MITMRIMKAFMDDLRTIRGVLNSILVLVVVTGLFLGLRNCTKERGLVAGDVLQPHIERTPSGRVVVRFHADNTGQRDSKDLVIGNAEHAESTDSTIPSDVKRVQENISIPLDELRNLSHRRYGSFQCSGRSCGMEYRWYGWSFAPGLEISAPGALGLDIRWAYVGDFSAISGLSYSTKEEQIQPSIGLAYNLKVIRYLKNTDLFVSYTPKGVIGGLRMELGD